VARPAWPELSAYPADLPVWVSADAAFGEDGKLDSELFLPGAGRRLEELLHRPKNPATGCLEMTWIEQEYVNPPDRSSLPAALRSSELVVWGEVVAASVGFERGDLGQLLQIRPIEVLRSRIGDEKLPFYYVFVPAGRLRFAGFEVCKIDPRVVVPEMGEEVVIFAHHATAGESYLNLEYEGSLAAFALDGKSRLPRILVGAGAQREAPGKSELIAEIRSLAAVMPVPASGQP
jgi:hypothetical protein